MIFKTKFLISLNNPPKYSNLIKSYMILHLIKFFILSLSVCITSALAKNKEGECNRKDCFPESSSTWNMIDTEEVVEKKRILLKKQFNLFIQHKSLEYKKKILIKQQLSWLKFTKDRCEFIGETSGAGGHWSYVQTNNCLIKHYESRIDLLRSSLNCLKLDYGSNMPNFGYNHCIDDFHKIIDADRDLF